MPLDPHAAKNMTQLRTMPMTAPMAAIFAAVLLRE